MLSALILQIKVMLTYLFVSSLNEHELIIGLMNITSFSAQYTQTGPTEFNAGNGRILFAV